MSNYKNINIPQHLKKRCSPEKKLADIYKKYHIFAVQIFFIMSRVCVINGKKPMVGHTVSHSNIKTKRRFLPNLQTKRFFLLEENRWISLKVSTKGLKTINKNGLFATIQELRKKGVKV